MPFHVFAVGRIAVEAGDVLVEYRLGNREARLAFAFLLAERNHAVSRDELAEVLWPGQLPRSREAALRCVVSKVRHFLGDAGLPAGETLTDAFGCYQLRLPPDTIVDLDLAASALQAAERALSEGDLDVSCTRALVAHSLASQTFLPGEEGEWIDRRRAERRMQVRRALEILAEVWSRRGEVARGVRIAEELGIDLSPETEAAYLELLGPMGQPPFVGREYELRLFRALWEQCQDGDRQVVLLKGEAGSGKTRLVVEFATALPPGTTVFYGRCAKGMDAPYQPFVDALGDHVSGLTEPSGDPRQLFRAVTSFLASAASGDALVLVLEDVQWSRPEDLLLLRHVARNLVGSPVLVVATYRGEGARATLCDLLAELGREPAVQRLTLSGLDGEAIAALVSATTGTELDEAGLRLIRALCDDGNAFLLTELLRGLLDCASDRRAPSAEALADVDVPPAVQEAIAACRAGLSERANRTLDQAAVLGEEFELSLLEEVGGLADVELLDALEETARVGLAFEVPGRVGCYRFTHALTRAAVLAAMGGTRRARLGERVHRRAAHQAGGWRHTRPRPRTVDRSELALTLAFSCASALVLFIAMRYRIGSELADDGAFFVRYAKNIARGHFWVWNLGDAPVWGASAPFYPLLIALPIGLGLPPRLAVIGVGLSLSLTALVAIVVLLNRKYGPIAAVAFLLFAAMDSGLMYWPASGLETPLTIALLAAATWAITNPPPFWAAGAIAGALMVHKIDLIPIGLILLAAYGIEIRRPPTRAIYVAGLVFISWYGFAWIYFGMPIPNAFLTKLLHQGNLPTIIDWTWFGKYVLFSGIHRWIVGLAIIGLWRSFRARPSLAIFLGGTITIHIAAYTIKYPFEPYYWYAIPAIYALTLTAAIGAATVATEVGQFFSGRRWAGEYVGIILLSVVALASLHSERVATASLRRYVAFQERDRAEAGRWVSHNTPKNFTVYTGWGNPALFSERRVLDSSFLNRKFEQSDLVTRYRPEIMIRQGKAGSSPTKPTFDGNTDGYRTVKVFARSHSEGLNYYFGVLARTDIIGRVTNIEMLVDLMAFVRNERLGDTWGRIQPQGIDTMFIHPGARAPTSFSFMAPEYLLTHPKPVLTLDARISPKVSEADIRRGGGVVRLRVLQEGMTRLEAIVDSGNPFHSELPQSSLASPLEFIVDNHGNSDTDWLLLSIH